MIARFALLMTLAVLPISAAVAQVVPAQGVMKGYVAPPAIPGYEPTADPRDFSGVWRNVVLPGAPRFEPAAGIRLNDTAKAAAAGIAEKMKAARATTLATPHVMCRPTGLNQAMFPIAPIYVLQNDRKLVFIVTDEIRNVREVYLDTDHPKNLKPSYGGHSVAHWEANTLVIDTRGYNGRGQMIIGSVHSDKLHLVERVTKSADGKSLDIEAMFEDLEVLAEPVHVKKQWSWVNGQQPLEFDCEENPREDNFSGMYFDREYLKPVCIQHEGKDEEPSKVVCTKP
jgi:hypothetical protein